MRISSHWAWLKSLWDSPLLRTKYKFASLCPVWSPPRPWAYLPIKLGIFQMQVTITGLLCDIFYYKGEFTCLGNEKSLGATGYKVSRSLKRKLFLVFLCFAFLHSAFIHSITNLLLEISRLKFPYWATPAWKGNIFFSPMLTKLTRQCHSDLFWVMCPNLNWTPWPGGKWWQGSNIQEVMAGSSPALNTWLNRVIYEKLDCYHQNKSRVIPEKSACYHQNNTSLIALTHNNFSPASASKI